MRYGNGMFRRGMGRLARAAIAAGALLATMSVGQGL